MTLLLDTHVFLWALMEPDKLSAKVRDLLENPGNELLVSSASAWEISTKCRLGKLTVSKRLFSSYGQVISGLGARSIPVTDEHALKAGSWDIAHRDPFDRMLAAQAHLEKVPIVSADIFLDAFGIDRIW